MSGGGRRDFLRASGGGLAAFGLLGAAGEATGAGAATGEGAAPGDAGSYVLHDPRLALPADVEARLRDGGAVLVPLHGDVVAFWRSSAAAPLRDRTARLLGLTRWADFLILRGLAAETRRHVRYERLNPDNDAFTWLIASA